MSRNDHRAPGVNAPRPTRLSNASLAWWPGVAGIGFGLAMLAGAGGHPTGFVVAFLAGSAGVTAVGALVWAANSARRGGETTAPPTRAAYADIDDDIDVELDELVEP